MHGDSPVNRGAGRTPARGAGFGSRGDRRAEGIDRIDGFDARRWQGIVRNGFDARCDQQGRTGQRAGAVPAAVGEVEQHVQTRRAAAALGRGVVMIVSGVAACTAWSDSSCISASEPSTGCAHSQNPSISTSRVRARAEGSRSREFMTMESNDRSPC